LDQNLKFGLRGYGNTTDQRKMLFGLRTNRGSLTSSCASSFPRTRFPLRVTFDPSRSVAHFPSYHSQFHLRTKARMTIPCTIDCRHQRGRQHLFLIPLCHFLCPLSLPTPFPQHRRNGVCSARSLPSFLQETLLHSGPYLHHSHQQPPHSEHAFVTLGGVE
jgi:hypothetical protein